MLKENITNISIGDGFRLGNLGRSLMLPPLPVPMTGFLNGYQQRMQANFPTIPEFEVFGKAFNGFEGRSGRSNRKPLVINTSDAIKSPVQRPFVMAIQGDIASIPGFNAESFLEKHLKTEEDCCVTVASKTSLQSELASSFASSGASRCAASGAVTLPPRSVAC